MRIVQKPIQPIQQRTGSGSSIREISQSSFNGQQLAQVYQLASPDRSQVKPKVMNLISPPQNSHFTNSSNFDLTSQTTHSSQGDRAQVFNIQQLLSNNPLTTKTSYTNYSSFSDSNKPHSHTPSQAQSGASEISKIASNLRDILHQVQRNMNDGAISDLLNDKILEVLSGFRKVEEQLNQMSLQLELKASQTKCCEQEKRIATMGDDYQKLKAIMDSLQEKMTLLVQENSKLNRNLLDYDTKLNTEMCSRRISEERAQKLEQECQRAVKCIESHQRETEDLKSRLNDTSNDYVRKQLFDDSSKYRLRELEDQNQQLKHLVQEKVKFAEQLQVAYNQKQEEFIKLEKESRSVRPTGSSQYVQQDMGQAKVSTSKYEQLELRFISLQIENENLKSEMAHVQIDNKAMDQKNDMINKMEERVRSLLRDKSELEQCNDQLTVNSREVQHDLQNTRQQLKEVVQYNSELKEKVDLIPKLEKEYVRLRDALQNKENLVVDLEKSLASKSNIIKNLEQEQKDLNQMNQKKIQEKQRELDGANQRQNEVQDQLSRLRDQFELQKKVFAENNEDLQRRVKQERQKCEEQLIDIRRKMQELDDQCSTLSQQLRQSELKLAQSQQESQERQDQLHSQLQQKEEQIELVKGESEKFRSANYNLQEELLRAGMIITQLQSATNQMKSELNVSRTEQENLIELLKKRKEEASMLHQALEQARKCATKSKTETDEGRKSYLRQQDLQLTVDQFKKDNHELKSQVNALKNELQRKYKEVDEKEREIESLRNKYDETLGSLINVQRN